MQSARFVERDAEAAADAFVHICLHLRDRRAARLRSYDVSRPGRFEAWLAAVALHLARDARRQRLGRCRPLALPRRLPLLEQRVCATPSSRRSRHSRSSSPARPCGVCESRCTSTSAHATRSWCWVTSPGHRARGRAGSGYAARRGRGVDAAVAEPITVPRPSGLQVTGRRWASTRRRHRRTSSSVSRRRS